MSKPILILILSSFLIGAYYFISIKKITDQVFNCPDTVLYDFERDVKSKPEATSLFKEYFSEEKGYLQFDVNKFKESPSAKGDYQYYGGYGIGPNGAGGYLFKNGKLVKKGYCK